MPFSGGNLTFSYYLDADGVKVPHGEMSYEETTGRNNNCLYSEKGTTQDGYREGEWIVQQKYPKLIHKKILSYKKGLLDGECRIEDYSIDPKTKKQTLEDKEVYHFINGHIFGENKFVTYKDTVYCNFNEKGKKVGIWKYIDPEFNKFIVAEFSTENPENTNCYKLDILGNKEDYDLLSFKIMMSNKLNFLDNKFKNLIFFNPEKARVKLPIKEDAPYGLYDSKDSIYDK
jgi:hypothetical protein